jgi:hypothetical protein
MGEAGGRSFGQDDHRIVVWLLSWLVLGLAWKDREVSLGSVIVISAILPVLGHVSVTGCKGFES